MTENVRRLDWPRLLAQGCAIVVSILLAFAIDAWWDATKAGREEVQILEGLRTDFEGLALEAARIRTANQRMKAASERLMELTGPDASIQPDVSADTLLAQLLTIEIFRRADGTLAALLSSRGLGAIGSQDLRVALGRFPPRMADVERAEMERRELYLDHLLPYLRRTIPIRSLDAISSPELGAQESRFRLDVAPLLRDLEFENLLNDVYFLASQAVTASGNMEASARAVVQLLESELGR